MLGTYQALNLTGPWRLLLSEGGPWVTTGRCFSLHRPPSPPCTWTCPCYPSAHSCQVEFVYATLLPIAKRPKIPPKERQKSVSGVVASPPHAAKAGTR